MGMDVLKTPLQGLNLVEASAGTGKTHTLTTLYLRLVLERELEPEAILVMTYTKAATAELKQRIRDRLAVMRQGLLTGQLKDETTAGLAALQPDRERALHLLELALAGFDQASIFTIHGFCQRVLTEQAFETGQAFHMELVPDQMPRQQEVVDDFWRREVDRLPPLFLQAFRRQISGPEQLLSQIRFALGKPYLKVRSAVWPDNLSQQDEAVSALRDQLRVLWDSSREEIQALLSDTRILKGNAYRPDWVAGWCTGLTHWLTASPYERPYDKADRFTPERIAKAVKKGQQPPQHPLFEMVESYLSQVHACTEVFDQAWSSLLGRCYAYIASELPRRQADAGEWSYDDLLLQLHRALGGTSGERLAALLRNRYPAALVDEFQDTDPVQYDILHAIYGASDQPLFLVGDPKQAIYSFRGADLFAYLRARSELVTERHQLDTNWRSSGLLIQAVNTLFQRPARPFWYPQIDFQPVAPAGREIPHLRVAGDAGPPLRIWRLPFDGETPVERVRQAVAEATADEIARLLALAGQERAQLDGRPLAGGDMAVLVRTHDQAERMAQSLRSRGVNSVRTSQQSVFWSREAESLERLLLALLEPQRGGPLRAALATPLMGWDASGLDELNRDDRRLGQITSRFFDYHRLWREQGFIVMFRRLLIKEGVENRLLDYVDGERRVTNLLHLSELLYQQESDAGAGMEGLVKWLSRQRQESQPDENRLLRLESDSHLVRIDTLHGSKGLEYGIVFCPYLWDGGAGRSNQEPYLFHDPDAGYGAVLELGSERFDQDHEREREERLAESLRLLYVALTRARHRCYLPWGSVKGSGGSALAWLLHSQAESGTFSLDDGAETLARLDDAGLNTELEALAAGSAGSIAWEPMPVDGVQPQQALSMPPQLTQARRFNGFIPSLQRIASFSSLVSGHSEDLPDYDAQSDKAERLEPLSERFDIHGFPRGSGAGRCLHAILEQVDFQDLSQPGVLPLIEEQLRLHAIEPRWSPVVMDLLGQMVVTPLSPQGLTLDQVAREKRLDEMEFHFPVHRLDPARIQRLGERHGFSRQPAMTQGLGGVSSERLDGFIKGFIDLTFEWRGRFYLADYKSNWLGQGVEEYHPEALQGAMLEHGYPLQYALYTLALHRYLRRRLDGYDYDRHMGGVYYLFLRGINPESGPDRGVVAERPDAAFIEALDRLVAGEES
jgi:exodeoxyribonuclease V beta subunit